MLLELGKPRKEISSIQEKIEKAQSLEELKKVLIELFKQSPMLHNSIERK